MKMVLINRKSETTNVDSFIFKPEQPIGWVAGQFLHYTLNHKNSDERGPERWFTISAAPYEKNIRLTTRYAGSNSSSFKNSLFKMKAGDIITADSPEGDFLWDDNFDNHILVAGGIGITPFIAMLLQLDYEAKPIKAVLMYANQDNNLAFKDELRGIESRHNDFSIQQFIGNRQISATNLQKYAKDKSTIFYVSGPRKMVIGYSELLDSLKVPKDRVKKDFFPGY